jgi:hypothetical protein
VLEFDMVDPRFIEETDVLSTIDQRPNLMELTPSEFETLITNLFEKMGLETRLTQASRDGGVDCVAYDPRPIFGGKVVIQAKRYKHTVGVSAVRDLFGTMQNEGASKGILVTTSGYGKASFEFAEASRSSCSAAATSSTCSRSTPTSKPRSSHPRTGQTQRLFPSSSDELGFRSTQRISAPNAGLLGSTRTVAPGPISTEWAIPVLAATAETRSAA